MPLPPPLPKISEMRVSKMAISSLLRQISYSFDTTYIFLFVNFVSVKKKRKNPKTCLSFSISISYIVYCQLDQGASFVLQKVQYDAAGKLSVRSSSTAIFPIIKSNHPFFKKEKKINKVIILDTKKK